MINYALADATIAHSKIAVLIWTSAQTMKWNLICFCVRSC